MTDLSPTGRVVLGMLALGNRTGYDIKQVVDKSTRHFWAASYGQIYPELRRLEDQGLVRSHPGPSDDTRGWDLDRPGNHRLVRSGRTSPRRRAIACSRASQHSCIVTDGVCWLWPSY